MASIGVADWKTAQRGNTKRALTAAASPSTCDAYLRPLSPRPFKAVERSRASFLFNYFSLVPRRPVFRRRRRRAVVSITYSKKAPSRLRKESRPREAGLQCFTSQGAETQHLIHFSCAPARSNTITTRASEQAESEHSDNRSTTDSGRAKTGGPHPATIVKKRHLK